MNLSENYRKNLKESNSIDDYINRLNELYHEFFSGLGDSSKEAIKDEVCNILDEIPDGTILYQNYKDKVSGYTSMGSYSHEYADILKYTKTGNKWKSRYGLKDTHDMMLSVLYNNGEIKTKEQAEKDQKEMEKDLHSETKFYAPSSSNTNSDNPYWDGNFYGI